MPNIDPDDIEEKILQNEELVHKILESAEHVSAPMTLAEFMASLKELSEDDRPSPN